MSLQVTAIFLAWTCLLAVLFSSISKAEFRLDRGQLIENLAIQMAQTLDYEMYIHFQEITTLADLDVIRDSSFSSARKQVLLDNLQHASPDYAWIGFTSPQGIVEASTGNILARVDVSERPWFVAGQLGATVQDVHNAKLLAELVPNPGSEREPLRLIDIAVPVQADDVLVGVLGAHLYWHWVTRVREGLMAPLEDYHRAEIVILSKSGELLLAPKLASERQGYQFSTSPDAVPILNTLRSYQFASLGQTGSQLEIWPDQQKYLTGYAQTQGYQAYPGLGWIVLVRQNMDEALAPTRHMQRYVLLWGAVAGISSGFVAWWFAGRVTQPVLAIAQAADRMSRGDRKIQIPIFAGRDELATLSHAIAALFQNLDTQNQQLEAFNADLENTVQHRTKQLHQLNQRLQQEVEDRKVAQIDLEAANQELQRLSIVDGLTQIANRRCFDIHLSQEWERAYREQQPISLLIIDVDCFKHFNDTYGHQAGDYCLQRLAQAFMSCIKRPADLVARYGGEEFAIILPSTSHFGAMYCAQTIQSAVADLQIPHRGSTVSAVVTLSIGITTTIPDALLQEETLIAQADQCLYQAKIDGRDRIIGIDLRARVYDTGL